MTSYMLAACVVFGLVAVGEVISYLTKAVVPSMAGALILYLILIWCGMPQTYPETAGFTTMGDMAFYMLCVGVGTGVAPGEYVKNLKSVIMALVSVIVALILTVDPIGQPIASFILRKYAKKLNAEDAYLLQKVAKVEDKQEVRLTKRGDAYGSPENPSPFFPAWLPSELDHNGVVLLEMALAVWGAVALESVTGMSAFLWCFLIGILGCLFGAFRLYLFDERANSSGFLTVLIIGYLLTSMNGLTPQAVISVLPSIVALIVLSAVGLGLGGYISGKFFGYDPILSAAAGVGIMFLFPGISIVSTEVSARAARNEEERKFIYGQIAPSMYIMGNTGFLFGLLFTVTVLLPMLAR